MPGPELAGAIGTTVPYITQVMTPLVGAGWVEGKRGPSGGYSLVVDPRTISVLDLIQSISGPVADGRCVLIGGRCGEEPCSLHDAWSEAQAALIAALADQPTVE